MVSKHLSSCAWVSAISSTILYYTYYTYHTFACVTLYRLLSRAARTRAIYYIYIYYFIVSIVSIVKKNTFPYYEMAETQWWRDECILTILWSVLRWVYGKYSTFVGSPPRPRGPLNPWGHIIWYRTLVRTRCGVAVSILSRIEHLFATTCSTTTSSTEQTFAH